jgi:serine/threonine-protein kinase HipA
MERGMVEMKSKILHLFMNNFLIGRLEKTTKGGLVFTYDEKWLATPSARPISLSLPLISKPFEGDIVYNFFDNLLPDNYQVRSRIQTHFHIPTSHPFDLLAVIGRDCVGAIQIVEENTLKDSLTIHFDSIKEKDIAEILLNTRNFPLGMKENEDFRISIAGAQEKTAFLNWKGKWKKPLGSTPTTHIFKLPIGFIEHQQLDLSDSCENEWLCAQITEAFGLPVAKCEIQHFDNVKTLIVERFDRKLSHDETMLFRLPQEDMCQALGFSPNLKYQSDGGPGIEKIMRLLLGSADPMKDRDNFFRSQILFFLLAAIDGHAKNFSLHIEPGGQYRLTPLYDIISAFPLIQKTQLRAKNIKMAMALKGKSNHYNWAEIQRRHFFSMAAIANYSVERAEEIMDEMLEKVEFVIEKVSSIIPDNFPPEIYRSIFEGMRMVKRKLRKPE